MSDETTEPTTPEAEKPKGSIVTPAVAGEHEAASDDDHGDEFVKHRIGHGPVLEERHLILGAVREAFGGLKASGAAGQTVAQSVERGAAPTEDSSKDSTTEGSANSANDGSNPSTSH